MLNTLMMFNPVTYNVVDVDANEYNPRNLSSMAKSVGSAMKLMKSTRTADGVSSKISKLSKITRTEIKLI